MGIKHVSLAVAGIAIASLALAGCASGSGSDDAAPAAKHSTAAEKPSPEPTATKDADAASDDSAGGTDASAAVKVTSDKIVDDQMGHTVQADQVVRNFPWTSAQSGLADRDDNEQVLVHVNVTAGDKYYSYMGCDALKVQAHGQTESYTSQDTTMTVEDAMQAAGYPALQKVDQGQSGDGWCAYSVTDPTDTLDLEYMRSAAAGSDGTQITAKDTYAAMTPVS